MQFAGIDIGGERHAVAVVKAVRSSSSHRPLERTPYSLGSLRAKNLIADQRLRT